MTKKEMQCAKYSIYQTSSVLSPFAYQPLVIIFNESSFSVHVFSPPLCLGYIDYIVCTSEYL